MNIVFYRFVIILKYSVNYSFFTQIIEIIFVLNAKKVLRNGIFH